MRVAKEVGKRRGFELEGGKEGGTRRSTEGWVKEDVLANLRLATARAHESFRLAMSLVCTKSAGRGL